ncbi:MAG: hypothetical protein WB679_12825 [Terracidiphilus sp.]
MKSVFNELMSGLDDVQAYFAGETEGFRVHLPEKVNVKEIRRHLHMTQAKFSDTFGFSLDAVKHWEGGRRIPDPSARAYLTIIDQAPEMVIKILGPNAHAHSKPGVTKSGHTTKRSAKTKRSKESYAFA